MKVALIHDDFMQYGGAEKLVAAMLEVFPTADIYTSLYDPKVLKKLGIPEEKVTASFVQRLPLKQFFYRGWFFLYPLAFESLSSAGQMDQYDLVVSSTARFAHGILTKPKTKHVAYVNSPGRMWWEPERYFGVLGLRFFRPFQHLLQTWDRIAMSRVDFVVANSQNVAQKIEKFYGRKADAVIYPFFTPAVPSKPLTPPSFSGGGFFLVVTRLVRWKRVDIAIEAFKTYPEFGGLVVVGSGSDKRRLRKFASGSENIIFLSGLTDVELQGYYENCRALIVTQEEDFGMTPLEAMSHGKPVIALGKGGVLETVEEGKHGLFFKEQTVVSLSRAIKQIKYQKFDFDQGKLKTRAKEFSREKFKKDFKNLCIKCSKGF